MGLNPVEAPKTFFGLSKGALLSSHLHWPPSCCWPNFAICVIFAKFAGVTRGPYCLLIGIGLQFVGNFDQFAIFARFAKFTGFRRGPSWLLICIGLQVVGNFDPFAIFARFTKFAKFACFPRGPSCLLICIGLQVVVGEILPFLLLCAFLDIWRGWGKN